MRAPEMTKKRRLGVTLTGRRNSRGQFDAIAGSRRMISPERVVCLAEGQDGTVARLEGADADISLGESLDQIVAQSGGALIKLTPVGFEDEIEGEDLARHGASVAVNPDHLIILPTIDKRGTVIRMPGAERAVVVKETVAEIEAML